MSRGAKRVLGVAAAIAIPYAAPYIASAIGASAALGAVGGSALVGAGLGAAQAGILGGDIARGALLGGVGGGVGGYIQQPAAATYNTATGDIFQAPTPTGYNAATGDAFNMAGQTAGPMSYSPATGDAYGATGGVSPTAPTAGLQQPKSFTEAISQVPGEIGARLTDPRRLADITLRAGAMLAGSAFAGEGLSAEEEALLNEQVEELRTMRQQNAALFQQRLDQAQNLMNQAAYLDPEYFGLQSARRAQLAGATAKRAGLRGLEGERRGAEARRYDLGTARNVGTAYDTGYASAIGPRIQTTQAGLASLPASYPSTTGSYSALANVYAGGDQRRRQRVDDVGELFGGLTGSRGPREEYGA